MATGTIKSFAQPEVDFRSGTNVTTTIPTNAYTNAMSITLPAGTWLIIAHGAYTASFTEQFILAIRKGNSQGVINNTVVRGTGESGGGLLTAHIETINSQTTYHLAMYQMSGSNKTADQRVLNAVRLR